MLFVVPVDAAALFIIPTLVISAKYPAAVTAPAASPKKARNTVMLSFLSVLFWIFCQ